MRRAARALRATGRSARDHWRAHGGFTIFEVTAVSIVAATLIGACLELSLSASQTMSLLNAQGVLQLQLTQAVRSFNHDAHLATESAAPCPGTAFAQDLTSVDDGRATLILRVPSLDATGQPISGSLDCLIYDFDLAGQPTAPLRRTVDAANPGVGRANGTRIIANDLDETIFNNNGNPALPSGMVKMRVRGLRTERGRPYNNVVLEISATFRN